MNKLGSHVNESGKVGSDNGYCEIMGCYMIFDNNELGTGTERSGNVLITFLFAHYRH